MNADEWEIRQLEREVGEDPRDPFLRWSLACLLASSGDDRSAMSHLGVAMDVADGAIAAGCVAAAIRQITDEFARLWQLASGSAHFRTGQRLNERRQRWPGQPGVRHATFLRLSAMVERTPRDHVPTG